MLWGHGPLSWLFMIVGASMLAYAYRDNIFAFLGETDSERKMLDHKPL